MFDALKERDRELLIFLNNLGSEPFDSFWIFVTQIESWTALFVFFTLLIFYFYKSKKGLFVFASVVVTFAITLFLTGTVKELVARLRPNNIDTMSHLIRVLKNPVSYSFFSGHASNGFAIATFVVLVIRKFNKWIYVAYLWPLLFVFSRIYIGVHYPSDILAGAFVGTVIAIIMYRLCNWVLQRNKLFNSNH